VEEDEEDKVVYETCDPEDPENAIAGMPSFAASVAAPTVPDMRTVEPRLLPTLGPETTRAGAPPKNSGASV